MTAESPASGASGLTARLSIATARILHTAADISDRQAREASLLPGWTRGHVLTHIARNADSLRNLLVWAHTGIVTPQYPSVEARNEAIEAGAGRPAAELAADVAESAAAFAAQAASLSDADWHVEVHGLRGRGHPAWYTLWRRLSEVEIHHVDLAAGYAPADWPTDFARQCLARVADEFAKPDCPAAVLRPTDGSSELRIGPPGPGVTVTGGTRQLLAWLLGRSAGSDLVTSGPLPDVPAW